MSGEVSNRNAFEAKLAEIYAGEIVPACHDADEIRELALISLGSSRQFWIARRLPSGKRVYESKKRYQGQWSGQDAIFSIGFEASTLLEKIRQVGEDPSAKVLSLLMNHDFLRPAALIAPPPPSDSDNPSSSVIVYNEVNNPQHIRPVLHIVASMCIDEAWARKTYPHASSE